jgi:hypothetical protein
VNVYYLVAAVLLILLGLLHSGLGERLVIAPLLDHEQLPKLLGSRGFMGRVLRFTWHITTVLLWGIAGLLIYWAVTGVGTSMDAFVVVAALLVSTVISAVIARLKHFSWWVLLLSAVLVWWGTA